MTRTPPFRDKTSSSHLGNFFRYLFQSGKTAIDLASSIPSVAQRSGARLPRYLTPVLIRSVCRAIVTPCVTSLAGPVVANSLPGPGATLVATRYHGVGLSRTAHM